MSEYLTIDVGGTNIKYAIMDENANISEKGEYPTPRIHGLMKLKGEEFKAKKEEGLNAFISGLKELYDRYAGRVEAVVMSAPGKIDANNGYFYTSGALEYVNEVNLKDRLAEFIPVPFAVENDAKAAALAELWKGSMQGVTNGMVMTLGTGIGGAIIINGSLYRGSTFAAGELSGVSTRLDLEHPYQGGYSWATQNSVGRLVADYAAKKNLENCDGRILFTAANEGDQDAIASIDKFCTGLAVGIMSLQFALDVEKVAIGGGISKQPILMERLLKAVHTYYDPAIGIMPASIPEITSCTFGNDANMIGALYHYLVELKK